MIKTPEKLKESISQEKTIRRVMISYSISFYCIRIRPPS